MSDGRLEALQERIEMLEGMVAEQEDRLAGMVQIAANLASSRDPGKAMRAMVNEISTLLHADRTTIYELRRNERMLRGLAVQSDTHLEVGIPLGDGIAGKVASRGRSINLKDAYKHPDFDPKYDKLTGYRTRSMLVVPMRNPKRQVIGVVQVLNKSEGYFTVEDEHLLNALATQAAITLEALHLQLKLNVSNTELRDLSNQLQQKVTEFELLYDNERAIAGAMDVEGLCDRVLRVVARVADCQAAAIYLPDESGFGPTYIRAPEGDEAPVTQCFQGVGEGVLGQTASRAESLVLVGGDFEEQGIPRLLGGSCGVHVHDAVTAPILDGERLIGALAMINRRATAVRDDAADRRLAVLIAGQISRAVVRLAERRDAQQRDRLMTIGQMLSGVLHDLKGPMTIISGYAQLMGMTDDPAERESMAESIRRQVANFNDMTREVMAFARGERKVFARKVYLDKFVRTVTEALEPEFRDSGVELVVENNVKRTAWFDESKMVRVVANIARNARQALGDHGTFTWTLDPADDGGIRFVLSDDGPGIPRAIRSQLFDAFITSGKKDGTGLGLAIVRRIVEDHGGQVDFDTAIDRGTTFTIDLPGPEVRAETGATA